MIGTTFAGLFTLMIGTQTLWAQSHLPGKDSHLGKQLTLSSYQDLVNDRNCVESLRNYLGCISSLEVLLSVLDRSLSIEPRSLYATDPGSNIIFSTRNLIIAERSFPEKHQVLISPVIIYNQIKEKHEKFKRQFTPLYDDTKESGDSAIDEIISFELKIQRADY